MLGKGLAAAILLVTARIIEVLVGIPLVLELRALLFVREAVGRRLEAVVFELHIRGAHRLPVVELTDIGALLEGTVAKVEEELGAGCQGRRVISKHDAVLARFKLVEVEQPLFGGEAIDEVEVALPVLDAVFPLGVFVLERKGVVGDAVLLQQD
ncbi:hypothetical protein D3C73_1107130 [compost metagenome]